MLLKVTKIEILLFGWVIQVVLNTTTSMEVDQIYLNMKQYSSMHQYYLSSIKQQEKEEENGRRQQSPWLLPLPLYGTFSFLFPQKKISAATRMIYDSNCCVHRDEEDDKYWIGDLPTVSTTVLNLLQGRLRVMRRTVNPSCLNVCTCMQAIFFNLVDTHYCCQYYYQAMTYLIGISYIKKKSML